MGGESETAGPAGTTCWPFFLGLVMVTALTTLQDVKVLWGIQAGETKYDAVINKLIGEVSAAICDYCNVPDFGGSGASSITEVYSGTGDTNLILTRVPVTGIVNIWLDDGAFFGDASTAWSAPPLVQGTDFCLQWDNGPGSQSSTGIVERIGSFWPAPPTYVYGLLSAYPGAPDGNIKVSYTYGFPLIPPAVQAAAELTIRKVYQLRLYGQHAASESQEGISYSVPASDWFGIINKECAGTLAKYRQIFF
jgi:hypothetical protein